VRRTQESLRRAFPLSWLGRRMKSLRISLIEPGESLDAYSAKTRLNTRLGFLRKLRDIGRECAQSWLDGRAAIS